MKRRNFVRTASVASAAFGFGLPAMGREDNSMGPALGSTAFKLNYAPHLGMFEGQKQIYKQLSGIRVKVGAWFIHDQNVRRHGQDRCNGY